MELLKQTLDELNKINANKRTLLKEGIKQYEINALNTAKPFFFLE